VTSSLRTCVREGLALLAVERLLLGIHDAAFPSVASEDVGRGSPHSEGASRFLEFASALGFDGLQLGPQGVTSWDDPSPYLGALFSRNPLSIALAPLTRPEWGELLRPETLARAVAGRPGPADRVAHAYAREAVLGALAEAVSTFRRRRADAADGADGVIARLDRDLLAFSHRCDWLRRDALYDVLVREHAGKPWRHWDGAGAEEERALWAPPPGEEERYEARRAELLARHALEVEGYAFVQLLAHAQHRELRARARALGLDLFGDFQAGMSERDAWAAQGFALAGWRMGAPPSRTNPQGQPWGYPVLDPRRYFDVGAAGARHDGPAIRFLRARARKLFAEYDGVRIDHPHALVCPWVYRDDADPPRAVRSGARLFSSPDDPELAAFAIARADQVNPAASRHADDWVLSLTGEQVERYATLFDIVMDAAREAGYGARDVACEILSTQPYPLRRVIERHGLGRFRVTQKADLARREDVYRGENARPEDWILLGNHDTPPIALVAERWVANGSARGQAEYLASRLLAPEEAREPWVQAVASDAGALAQAKLAELFVGPARNVMIFFTDLLGSREIYNVPGTVSAENWSLRLPADFREIHRARVAGGRALDLPRAVARVLRQRGRTFVAAHRDLIEKLETPVPP
jgi:4-alpha-glucanotransferase